MLLELMVENYAVVEQARIRFQQGLNEQQSLFVSQAQRAILDECAQAGELCRRVAGAYAKWRAVGDKLHELNRNEQEKLRLLDLWTFQRKEIEMVRPKPGEDAEL